VTFEIGDVVCIEKGGGRFRVVGFELDGACVQLEGERVDLFSHERFTVYAWRVHRINEVAP
jgi:hypothetical protein